MVDNTDPMCTSLVIDILDKVNKSYMMFIIRSYRDALVEFDFHITSLVILKIDKFKSLFRRFKVRFFYFAAFQSSTPEVDVNTVFLCLGAYWYVLLFCKGYFKVAAQVEVAYRSNDFKVWTKRMHCNIKPNLVIAFTCAAVSYCSCAFPRCNLDCFCSD